MEIALPQCLEMLNEGGRLVVISFHSLEDRIVKHYMRAQAQAGALPARLPVRAAELPKPRMKLIGKPIYPTTDEEVAANPRARSAVMRVAERVAHDQAQCSAGRNSGACARWPWSRRSTRQESCSSNCRQQQDQARQLEVEYGQLQLEQSTWAMHSRVEKIAANNLHMRVPPATRVHLVPPPPAPAKP